MYSGMAYGEEQVNDGPSDLVKVTLLGSLRSLRHEAVQQAGRDVGRGMPSREPEPPADFRKRVGVRSLKNYRDRLLNTYVRCDPRLCAALRERRAQHRAKCPRRTRTSDASSQGHTCQRCSTSTSPIVSTHRRGRATANKQRASGSQSPNKQSEATEMTRECHSNGASCSSKIDCEYTTTIHRSGVNPGCEVAARHFASPEGFPRSPDRGRSPTASAADRFRSDVESPPPRSPPNHRRININCCRNRDVQLKKFAEDTLHRMQYSPPGPANWATPAPASPDPVAHAPVTRAPVPLPTSALGCDTAPSHLMLDGKPLIHLIRQWFREANIACINAQTIRDIEMTLERVVTSSSARARRTARADISRALIRTETLTASRAVLLADTLVDRTETICASEHYTESSVTSTGSHAHPLLPRSVSVYATDAGAGTFDGPVTSTPKKKPRPKADSKLNAAEREYTDRVTELVGAWVETLPETFGGPEERDFKETIIRDLAGDIADAFKLFQLTSVPAQDRHKYLRYVLYRWVHRLEELDLDELLPHVDRFLSSLSEIPVPEMTRPRHGNRQAMNNLRHAEGERRREETFAPAALDILQDQISLWMNRQRSDIFQNKDESYRENKISELAQILEIQLGSKRPPAEISNDVARWLNDIVTPERQREIPQLAEDLKDRLVGLPRDATPAANRDRQRDDKAETASLFPPVAYASHAQDVHRENMMKTFINKFIEHNYDVEDHMARVAANQLLKLNLMRLSAADRARLGEQGPDSAGRTFPSPQTMRELEYIKDISDWLGNIPVDPAYNDVGNRERIEFVINLASDIRDVEEQRKNDADAMDYNLYMAGIVAQYMRLLPLHRDHKDSESITLMIDRLLTKIIAHREAVDEIVEVNETTDTTGINSDNIGDFIEEFILVHGNDIADEELKIEIWATRLIREIERALAETNAVTKGEVHNRCLENVPLPGEDAALLFALELDYGDEISDWMKNLPLSTPASDADDYETGRKICELAEKIMEMDDKSSTNLNIKNKDEFLNFLVEWISKLPLERSQTIVYSLVTDQLLRRVDKVKRRRTQPDQSLSGQNVTITEKSQSAVKQPKRKLSKVLDGNPGQIVIDIIEKWSRNLPITTEDEKIKEMITDDISVKLTKKVDELSIDPDVRNDDLLYRDLIKEEVHTILDEITSTGKCEMLQDRDDVETDIVTALADAQNIIKDKTASDAYKLQLENTIAASIPDPDPHGQYYDPGFEIYKSRLASAFILENFDNSVYEVKIRYENDIKKQVSKYFEHAQEKNSFPLTEEELRNGLYVELYKVPIPSAAAAADAAELVKTRCELDAWFELLPLREAHGLQELLDRDRLLECLAKTIRDIEKTESEPDRHIQKEVLKRLAKLPLLPERQKDVEKFAETLLKSLKDSVERRKCALPSNKSEVKKAKRSLRPREPAAARRAAADAVLELVQEWCGGIPLCLERNAAQATRDFLVTKILIKISELNAEPAVLGDDALYSRLLEDELEMMLSAVDTSESFQQDRDAWKRQLTQNMKSVMPLIKEEIAHRRYHETLDRTVDEFLQKPRNMSADKERLYEQLKNDIIDDFLQYEYDDNDDSDKHDYKMKVEEIIDKYLAEIVQNRDENTVKNDYYKSVKANELLSALANIPAQGIDFTRDIEELKMKNELSDFFEDLSNKTTERSKVNRSIAVLAKKLCEIEGRGYGPDSENKMKYEIAKTLNRLNGDVKPEAVDAFITRLKDGAAERRGVPTGAVDHASCRHHSSLGATTTLEQPTNHCNPSRAASSTTTREVTCPCAHRDTRNRSDRGATGKGMLDTRCGSSYKRNDRNTGRRQSEGAAAALAEEHPARGPRCRCSRGLGRRCRACLPLLFWYYAPWNPYSCILPYY